LIIAVLYFVSAVGSALAWEWFSFLFFRFLGGIGVGAASVVAPMYIAEISPARYRGRLVAVTQFNIVLGILLAFFSNFVIARIDLGEMEWRWMFGVEAVPAAVFFLLLFLTPRSPRWLVSQGRPEEAASVLARMGTDSGSVTEEVSEIQKSLDLTHHSLNEPFFQQKYRTPILLAVAIAMFNQLSGINALMYYAPHIFRMSGAGEDAALLQAVAVGGINLIVTMLALAIIDHFGRRKLMIVGSIGYIISLAAVAAAFYIYADEFRTARAAFDELDQAVEAAGGLVTDPVVQAQAAVSQATAAAATGGTIVLIGLLVFIAAHAFGQGAVIWVFISEIFPNRVRARGQALGSFTHWVMAALISWTFPVIADWSGGHTFAIYAAMMVLQLIWVLMIMPETKGIPLEQIQKKLGIE
jgi:MFS family permease